MSALVFACADPVTPDAGFADAGDSGALQDAFHEPDTGIQVDAAVDTGLPLDAGVGPDAGTDAGFDAGVDLTFETPVSPVSAGALGWNDYLLNDGPSELEPSGAACTSSVTGGYRACLHGGERRVVEMAGVSGCAGLTVSDSLGAFSWLCDDSSGVVRVFSIGLRPDKRLADLIDWGASPPDWRAISVTVRDATREVSSPFAVWWPNPVVVDDDGGSLSVAGTIYLATATPPARFTIDADRVGLVVQDGFTAGLSATNQTFLWVEGAMAGDAYALAWEGVDFSVLRGVLASGATEAGVYLLDSNHNAMSHVSGVSNGQTGVHLKSSRSNILSHIRVSDNSQGLYLESARDNTVYDVVASNNGRGVTVSFSPHTRLAQVVAANNNGDGISARSSGRSIFSNLTTVSNVGNGLRLLQSVGHTTMNLAAAGNNRAGLRTGDTNPGWATYYNTFANVAIGHSRFSHLHLDNSRYNYFTGLLEVGVHPSIACSTTKLAGLGNRTCVNEGASDATIFLDVELGASFLAEVDTDDPVNLSDVDGLSGVIAVADWVRFGTEFRAWGLDLPTPFPSVSHAGACTSGCRIFDYALAAGDTGRAGAPALFDVLSDPNDDDPIPDGDDILHHLWPVQGQSECEAIDALWEPQVCSIPGITSEAECLALRAAWSTDLCAARFLRNAVEVMEDGLGNENTLCESGETCLFTPHIGAYQGSGPLVSAGAFEDGALSGITLLVHSVR